MSLPAFSDSTVQQQQSGLYQFLVKKLWLGSAFSAGSNISYATSLATINVHSLSFQPKFSYSTKKRVITFQK